MKRLISLVARLYPLSWRAEFGEEFDALLGDVRPRWRVFANVLGGAITMQITAGTGWVKLVGVMAVVGVIVGGGVSFTETPRYVSSAVMGVTLQADPVRPTSPQVLQERAAELAAVIKTQVLSRASLSRIIQEFGLYEAELGRVPLEDVIEEMRSNIRIQARPSTGDGPVVFGVSFAYWDQATAETVTHDLTRRFREQSLIENRSRADAYLGFWGDMSVVEHTKPAPPPPVGEIVGLLNAANFPMKPIGPNRIKYLAWGLAVGLLLGVVVGSAMRWPRGVWQLAGFALAGCVLTGAASFMIPSRYTSTAVMEILPALINEDPLAPLHAVTPAAEFLRQMEPELSSIQRLSGIITDPRLNLYAGERAKKPMEEVVRDMLANDLRIAPLNQGGSAFSISFSYSDRYKAKLAVEAVMNVIDVANLNRQKATADASRNVLLHAITQRKVGEVLIVLDTASLPVSPSNRPNRLMIAIAGLCVGLLVGGIRLWLRRPGIPSAGDNAYAT